MLDINFIINNVDLVKDNIRKKNLNDRVRLVDELVELHKKSGQFKFNMQKIQHSRNELTWKINELKKEKKNKEAENLIKKAKEFPEKIKSMEEEHQKNLKRIREILLQIPNIMHKDVPIGKDASDNVEVKRYGKIRKFDFEVKNHAELGEELGFVDFESSQKVAGKGFYYLQGDLALLNQALIRFAIEKMISKGYTYVETPLMVRENVISNVTDLNDMQTQIYKINDEDLYLIGTSEHSLIGRLINSVIPESKLPIKETSYSMCFRKEIGAHGIDEKGLYRTHQFNKVEMIVICKPEESMKFFEEMKNITIEIFTELGIPIREVLICSGDLGDLKHIQCDIEAYSPRKKEYFEVGSCSNLTDCQARRLGIRVETKGKKYVPHTLNNTAIATSRALVAILENYQNKDGTVTIPDVLRAFMNGKTKIKNNKK